MPDNNLREQLFNKYLRVLKRSSDLDIPELSKMTDGFSSADIAQVCEESLRRAVVIGKTKITYDDIKFVIAEQKLRKELTQVV
jgi:ATP-dependent 26S proteasome regulatory subunit